MGTRWVRFRLDEELHEQALKAAAADRRSLGNWVSVIIERSLSNDRLSKQEADEHGR